MSHHYMETCEKCNWLHNFCECITPQPSESPREAVEAAYQAAKQEGRSEVLAKVRELREWLESWAGDYTELAAVIRKLDRLFPDTKEPQ